MFPEVPVLVKFFLSLLLAVGYYLWSANRPFRRFPKSERKNLRRMLRARDYVSLGQWVKARDPSVAKYNHERLGKLFAATWLDSQRALIEITDSPEFDKAVKRARQEHKTGQ